MNLILLEEGDFVSADRVRLRDRRLEHVRGVHRAAPGDELPSALGPIAETRPAAREF